VRGLKGKQPSSLDPQGKKKVQNHTPPTPPPPTPHNPPPEAAPLFTSKKGEGKRGKRESAAKTFFLPEKEKKGPLSFTSLFVRQKERERREAVGRFLRKRGWHDLIKNAEERRAAMWLLARGKGREKGKK